jgi:hypothetical protein
MVVLEELISFFKLISLQQCTNRGIVRGIQSVGVEFEFRERSLMIWMRPDMWIFQASILPRTCYSRPSYQQGCR